MSFPPFGGVTMFVSGRKSKMPFCLSLPSFSRKRKGIFTNIIGSLTLLFPILCTLTKQAEKVSAAWQERARLVQAHTDGHCSRDSRAAPAVNRSFPAEGEGRKTQRSF